MNVVRDTVYGCQLAEGRRDRDGYVLVGRSRAHILAWRLAGRDIPEDMELDHACRRRACVALHHLELVTRSENELRKSWRYRSRMKRCPKGHNIAGAANVIVVQPEGGRICRTCNVEATAA